MENGHYSFIGYFVDATVKVLETMAFISPVVGETMTCDHGQHFGEVIGVVGLTNEAEGIRGFMSVGFCEGSICQIVSSMLGETMDSMCEETREAVGEIANMISGQARQLLSSKGIKLQASLPGIISGKELNVDSTFKNPLMTVRFNVDGGPFEVGVCMDGIHLD